MSRVKPIRRAINGLPARRPSAPITIVGRGVESQAGNDCKGVTLARVDRDPLAGATFAVAAKFG